MFKKCWNGTMFILRCVLNIFWLTLIYILIFKISFVSTIGPSMYPTMWTGDFCVIYKTQNVERGDIVNITLNNGMHLMKRVIGLPGERLFISKQNVAVLNSRNQIKFILDEMYVRYHSNEKNMNIQLGPDEIWVMGDNRKNSNDSRDMGPVKLDRVQGKLLCILCRIPNMGTQSFPVIKDE